MQVLLATSCAAAVTRSLSSYVAPNLPSVASAQRTNVRRFANFLDEQDIESIHAAAATVNAVNRVSRSHGLKDDSWRTAYFNHRLAELLPSLYNRLRAAAQEADADADWDVLSAALGMRCAEYHTVHTSGGLPKQTHYDAGSLITMDLMLSHTSDFEGGVFSTLEQDDSLTHHTFERGDLLAFLSHKYHCVSPVTNGTRQVLVCELWEGLERRCPGRCNLPFGPCSCRLGLDGLYVRFDDDRRTDLATVPFSRSTPLLVKHGWTAMRKLRSARSRSPTAQMKLEPRQPPPPRSRPLPTPPPPSLPSPLSPQLLAADCGALAAVFLLASSLKAFSLALADLSSPGFDLAADLVSFDLAATSQYVGVEQFSAASPALSWIVGGVVSGACTDDWCRRSARARWKALAVGYLIAAPLTLLLKYTVLAQIDLPSLGSSAQALQLETQLVGLSLVNVLNDALVMLGTLLLWRQVWLRIHES